MSRQSDRYKQHKLNWVKIKCQLLSLKVHKTSPEIFRGHVSNHKKDCLKQISPKEDFYAFDFEPMMKLGSIFVESLFSIFKGMAFLATMHTY